MPSCVSNTVFRQDSHLTLPTGSKSSLLGFYTPVSCRDPRTFASPPRERHLDIWDHITQNAEWDRARLFGQDFGTAAYEQALPEAKL